MEEIKRKKKKKKRKLTINQPFAQFLKTGGARVSNTQVVRGKAQRGKCGVATLRQLSCTRQPVRVVASPRASRLLGNFTFTICPIIFSFSLVVFLLC